MKKIGKIRALVFLNIDHSNGTKYKDLAGYLIKRPDFLLMFHRKPAYIFLGDVVENDKGVLCIDSKNKIYKKSSLIANTNIKWKDAKLIYLEGITEDDIKKMISSTANKVIPKAKNTAKAAKDKAVDNLQTHSDSLHKMFKDFKDSYNEGRYGDDD